ncbi:PREDICTED: uncharacterized aarF domain-containing protein kinase 2 isoform X1 [Trachymyrmex septentrionalis]|uniref:uncharacterized aarF domain-containing protein kinase 2 isoform X1 n=2 Tax=Trachymyrmex septentrionalis TaxID=34720 RepID=UPI00084F54AC|nr:PREDICTED: uncharacterized aarF domain-containing protein kinase 2 isoform X1 [Trachymyrmex septentrionalis]
MNRGNVVTSNLVRLFTSLCRYGDNIGDSIACRRLYYRLRGRQFHLPLTRCRGEYPNQWTNYNLASTALSCKPRAQIRELQTMWPTYKEKEGEQKNGFLVDAQEMILILARIAIVSTVITILLVAYLITRLTCANFFPTILRKGIEFLGPIFIKFGQWISTRWDVFPRDVCNTLSQLQRNATSHSWLYTERLLEATYGPSWRNLFVRFDDKEPIGSGCCAQVYKAWIDQNATWEPQMSHFMDNKALNGSDKLASASPRTRNLQTIAVKVLHPGIESQLKRDIAIMRGLCKCVTYFIPKLYWLNLTDCIDEFARIMENQVDMRLEASNLVRFSANFSKRNDIIFPYPYTHLTRRRILVESFHEGAPISDYLKYNDAILQRRLARIGIAMVLQMIFKDNFIHCDLHPGNILVEKTVVPKASLFNTFWRVIIPDYTEHDSRLIILDCGLVVSLNERCRQNLRDVFYLVLTKNSEMAAQYILEHSSHMTPDSDGFKCSIKNIVKSHFSNPFNVSVSTVVSQLFSAMIHHRVKQDGSFSSVILSMLVIENLGRCLDPKIDIFTEMLPYVLRSVI